MGKSLNGKELGKMVRSYRGKCVVKQVETIINARKPYKQEVLG